MCYHGEVVFGRARWQWVHLSSTSKGSRANRLDFQWLNHTYQADNEPRATAGRHEDAEVRGATKIPAQWCVRVRIFRGSGGGESNALTI